MERKTDSLYPFSFPFSFPRQIGPDTKTYLFTKKLNVRFNFRFLNPLRCNSFKLFGFIYMFFNV